MKDHTEYDFVRAIRTFKPRWVPEPLLADLSNLWHLSRTGAGSDYHARLVWTAAQFTKEHPELNQTSVYKDLDDMLNFERSC